MLEGISRYRKAHTRRASSWDVSGRNVDVWWWDKGQSRVLADIEGPGRITHIWMTQRHHYRECLLKITWDHAARPSVLVPLGDFFGLGHGIVNSYQCALFATSTFHNNRFNEGCALNCYIPMPFRERARVELVNESGEAHANYFYIDYETYDEALADDELYFHAEWRRENPFGGWGHELPANVMQANVANTGRVAYANNYVLCDVKGRGHYLGCNMSVTNFQRTWWGEGDDMIWIDGYKWPPDLHGTGSEDYFNHAWGMQDNAWMRHGSSIHESHTGGYQTSYVHHLENPVRFEKSLKATIEIGHANHLANEVSTTAYWYADQPRGVKSPPPVAKRMPVLKNEAGDFDHKKARQTTSYQTKLTPEMRAAKAHWKRERDALDALDKARKASDRKAAAKGPGKRQPSRKKK